MDLTNIEFCNQSNSFIISSKKAMGHYDMPTYHFHDMYEIYYLLSGERFYFIKDRTFNIKKGDLVFINEHYLHKTTDTGVPDHQRILIKFHEKFLLTENSPLHEILKTIFKKDNYVLRLPIHEQNNAEELLEKMMQESQTQNSGFEAYLQSLMIKLLVHFGRYIQQNSLNSFEHPSPIYGKISEIVQYINYNYLESITLATISERFYISPYYLSRVFKEVTGFTFIEYLNSVRIKEAQKLLRESKGKVISIAEKVGFGNVAHFGRVFKKVTGLSPLHYRKLSGS